MYFRYNAFMLSGSSIMRRVALLLLLSLNVWGQSGVSYQNFQRLNDPKRVVRGQDRLLFNLDENYYWKTASFKTDLSWEMFLSDRSMNYSINEAYYFFSYYDLDFSVGRRLLEWNPNEKFWGNNFLNSRRNFTLLDLKREGLLGLHHSSTIKNHLSYDIFFSYFHIPMLNPRIRVADGNVTSDSEWVNLPPEQTVIYGVSMPIYYYLNRPRYRDTILKKSLGGRLVYHWRKPEEEHSGNLSLYGLYKPENSLRINAEASVEGERISVMANPIVNHHIIGGLSVNQEIDDFDRTWAFSSSIEFINPNAKIGKDFDAIDPMRIKENSRHFESNYFVLMPSYDKEFYWQGRVSFSNEQSSYSLHYFKLLSRPLVGDDFYSQANRWINAIGFDIKVNLNKRLDVGLDFKYDFDRKDNLLTAEFGHIINNTFLLGVGLELLSSPKDKSFWAPYRANDSMYVRMGHMF